MNECITAQFSRTTERAWRGGEDGLLHDTKEGDERDGPIRRLECVRVSTRIQRKSKPVENPWLWLLQMTSKADLAMRLEA